MVEGINSLNNINSSLNNLLSGGSSVSPSDNIAGILQGELTSTIGIDLAMLKVEMEAKVAVINAQNAVLEAAINIGNTDIQDTAQISQSYHNRAAVLNSMGQ